MPEWFDRRELLRFPIATSTLLMAGRHLRWAQMRRIP